MLLSIDQLEVRYGAIKAIHALSMNVDRGEIVTLIGANGAGKTTLLRAISGLLRPSRGTIRWNGNGSEAVGLELGALAAHEIVRLGVSHVPEGRQIFPPLTVHENLMLGAYQQRSPKQTADDLSRCLELFPVLAERRRQRAGTLSGGEQQMLAIGRALMARPTLLLLDEPSLGLAPLVVRKIFEIIREINRAGTTILLVEQNANLALKVAHRGYVLQSGNILLADLACNLMNDPDVKRAYLGG